MVVKFFDKIIETVINFLLQRMLHNIEFGKKSNWSRKYADRLWRMSGHLAARFYDKDSGECDILQDKFNYWILCGLKNTFIEVEK